MAKSTIQELTNNLYSELRYDSASSDTITGPFVLEVCSMLNKCGIDCPSKNSYDFDVSNAVANFQRQYMGSGTGVLTNATWQAMMLYVKKNNPDEVEGNAEFGNGNSEALDASDNPHYIPFFNRDNFRTHRRNRKDIEIIFGSGSIKKTIKDVFMRSSTVEVNTSGEPIAEVYEFIARDVQESDEIMDAYRYGTLKNEVQAASDIQYKFPY